MRDDTRMVYEERIRRVLLHIQEHLDGELRLEELASLAFLSPYHFHRVFRGMVGEPLMGHIRRLRLERAAHVLRRGREPVTRVALEAGYESLEAFSRAFQAHFGEPPSSYRRRRRPPAPARAPSGVHYTRGEELGEGGTLEGFRPVPPGDPPLEVRIEDLPPLRVAFVRHTGPYGEVGRSWGELMAWAGPRGLLGPSFTSVGFTCVGVVHDDPDITPPARLRYDSCLVAAPGLEAAGRIGIQELRGGRYAVARHRGPYADLPATYARLGGEWFPGSGREPAHAPALEFYRNSPQATPPAELITDIFLPLAPP